MEGKETLTLTEEELVEFTKQLLTKGVIGLFEFFKQCLEIKESFGGTGLTKHELESHTNQYKELISKLSLKDLI